MELDLNQIKKVFLIGIKGVGMATLAYIFSDLGIEVSGSDVDEEFVTQRLLSKRKIKIYHSFKADLISHLKPDLVITTGAHQGRKNPQFIAAEKANIPSLTHAQALGWLMKHKKTPISIAGVGGKTTISALLSHILETNKLKPAYSVGAGSIMPLIWPGKWGEGKYFVAEADEYATCPLTDHRPRFYWQEPKYLILTNIEYDHPDIYPNIEKTKQTFLSFSQRTLKQGGTVISYFNNPNNRWLITKLKKQGYNKIISYGFGQKADWQIEPLNSTYPFNRGRIISKDGEMLNLQLRLPGRFNLANATAAAITAYLLGISPGNISRSLATFTSVQRRFEPLGKIVLAENEIKLYDDYAHHPNEIKTTLKAAKNWFTHQRLGVIFQPHTFSRTKKLLNQFIPALLLADDIYISPVFSSAREKDENQANYQEIIYKKIKKLLTPHQMIYQVNNSLEVYKILKEQTNPARILFTMGAGDIYKWGKELIKYNQADD